MRTYRLTVTVRPNQLTDTLADTLVSLRAIGNACEQIGDPTTDKYGTHYRFDVVSREKAHRAHAYFCAAGLPVGMEPLVDETV